MKASIRVNSLTLGGVGSKTLFAQELHGKREDGTSQKRKVREVEPLVYGTLDLDAAYREHVTGARMNAGLKRPVLHALIQFPTGLPVNARNEKAMLDHAVKFINETHGGDAVFAARLDRDEAGRHSVDVFFSPKYEKRTKKGVELWISTSKHGKELCEKHREEIERRHKGKFKTGPRQVGIALQSELHAYLTKAGLKLEQRKEKDDFLPDRLEPEVYGAREDAKKLAAEARADREAAKRIKAEAEERLLAVQERERDVLQQQLDLADERVMLQNTDAELTEREDAVQRREGVLRKMTARIRSLIEQFADQLGIGAGATMLKTLDAIEAHGIQRAETVDPFNSAPDDPRPDRLGL